MSARAAEESSCVRAARMASKPPMMPMCSVAVWRAIVRNGFSLIGQKRCTNKTVSPVKTPSAPDPSQTR